jgi:hypothetical protein
MSPALISPDGRWWWDGSQWRSRLVDGELDLLWFTTTPDWFSRILLTGLIGLIPILGTINMYGWTLTAADMIRNRWRELPPAGFQYLERGVAPFLVGLIYGFAAFVVFGGLIGAAVVIGLSNHDLVAAAVVIGLVAILLSVTWWLLMLYLFAAIIVGSDRVGIGRALDPRRLWAIAGANGGPTLSVALTYFLGSLVLVLVGGAIGIVVPFGAFLINLALPAVFAMIVPPLARITIEELPAAGSGSIQPAM